MALKQDILSVLLENRGSAVSGEQLAQRFGVSRAAVWKAIAALKAEGNRIEAGSRRGYCLTADSDALSKTSLLPFLSEDSRVRERLTVLPECTCTNDLARILAQEGAPSGTAVVAESQTQGRGRRGHTFYSPRGGIYLSMVLRPTLPLEDTTRLTMAAAVAVCQAVQEVCDRELAIKWVNDLYWQGRKVGGILTEAAADLEGGTLDYAVVGVGLNVHLDQPLPPALRERAGALYEEKPDGECRSRLAAALLQRLDGIEDQPEMALEEYRARSFLPGRDIEVLSGRRTGRARALDITPAGGLLVQYPDGEQAILLSGAVRVSF